ncbi:hypothetical protein PORY_001095 [Pneumocystis oryctolagi]|uniref:Uncharacterized protein n=1 Tax=Pneumocystis oryctolagi TaxID=42067 RepID=A0ACB7CIH6_9ASCO|nr:hypothetical protein PORY_001095 [Pneumocystis oryctolagi]
MSNELRNKALSLYRALLRGSKELKNYGFREYAIRRTKDSFRAHKNETDIQKIQELLQKGFKELQVLRRQILINYMYQEECLVIEVDTEYFVFDDTKNSSRKTHWVNMEDIKKSI